MAALCLKKLRKAGARDRGCEEVGGGGGGAF